MLAESYTREPGQQALIEANIRFAKNIELPAKWSFINGYGDGSEAIHERERQLDTMRESLVSPEIRGLDTSRLGFMAVKYALGKIIDRWADRHLGIPYP